MKPPKKRATVPLSSVLPQVSRDLALDDKIKEFALVGLWDSVVDPRYRTRTRAVKVYKRGNETVLQVRVKDAATAGELSFSLGALRDTLNGYAPQTGRTIAAIDLKIGSL